jgi:endonuclease YncB( thermonuclease family)
MFTFVGDTVLDPFLGSGTTVMAALEAGRNAMGYEINGDFLETFPGKSAGGGGLPLFNEIHIIRTDKSIEELPEIDYTPAIRQAAVRQKDPGRRVNPAALHKVTQIVDETTIRINNGSNVRFLGVRIDNKAETLAYLRSRILGKKVFLRDEQIIGGDLISAYVYLKNRIFVNAHLIKCGWGFPDLSVNHRLHDRFIKLRKNPDEVKEPRLRYEPRRINPSQQDQQTRG